MRVAFFVLLLANLLFLAWAEWIAVPTLHADPLTGVPRLQLVREQTPPPPSGPAAAQASPGALSTALAGQAAASAAAPGGAHALRCVSVGPFKHHHDAVEVVTLLRAHHLAPAAPRTDPVEPVPWYWAYVPDVTGGHVRHALDLLHHDGLSSAAPMAAANGKPGISLGLFPERTQAQHEAHLAQAKGFTAEVRERLVAQPAYWVDVWAAGGAGGLPAHALQAKVGAVPGAQACPVGDEPPVPDDATGAVAPGVPLPSDQATAAPPP